jgi:hypothetical protein
LRKLSRRKILTTAFIVAGPAMARFSFLRDMLTNQMFTALFRHAFFSATKMFGGSNVPAK